MFYLAIAFLTAGLLCVLYYLLTMFSADGAREDMGASTPVPPTGEPAAPAPRRTPRPFRREGTAPAWGGGIRRREKSPRGSSHTAATQYARVDLDALADSLRVVGRRDAGPGAAEPPLMIEGVLFLNYNRRLPFLSELPREGSPRAFADIKRVGPGTLILEDKGIYIRCGNVGYSYGTAELEQILFQKKGLAIIPVYRNRPVAVFITEHAERVKEHIRGHAYLVGTKSAGVEGEVPTAGVASAH